MNDDSNNSIIFELSGNDTLILTFGGIKHGLGMPVFEFFNLLRELNCDKIFIRDFNQSWYQKGISEHITSVMELVLYLENIILNNNYKKICFIGNSMGGFAAILFGCLLNIDDILVFSPQTFIDKKRRFFYKDRRWKDQIDKMYLTSNSGNKFYNLNSKLLRTNGFSGNINVFYSLNDRLDKIHAQRLNKIDFVDLHEYNDGGHNLVSKLKHEGKLLDIIKKILC